MATTSLEQTTERLQARGERMTRGRRVVAALIAAQSRQSAEQILEVVWQVDTQVHRRSVYRTLDAAAAGAD